MLAIITKMTLTQVSTWFANARRRLKKENKMTWEPRLEICIFIWRHFFLFHNLINYYAYKIMYFIYFFRNRPDDDDDDDVDISDSEPEKKDDRGKCLFF